jgi:hypothetical protein
MAKQESQFALNLDAIQGTVHTFLKPLGFRKKGRTHNRRSDGGLTQVISFQMGQFPIGDNYVIPGFRESFYGKFAINLGILLPCVYSLERQQAPPDFVKEYHCTIRERLGCLAFGKDDWFELKDESTTIAKTVVELLDKHGLDFLDQFKTYQDVLSYYGRHGSLPFQNSNRASLEVAIIANHLGDLTLSTELFAKAGSIDHSGFKKHVLEMKKRLGQSGT